MIFSSSSGKSPEITNKNPSIFCSRAFRSCVYPFPGVDKVSILFCSNVDFVLGEFGLVATITLEKQLEFCTESTTLRITGF